MVRAAWALALVLAAAAAPPDTTTAPAATTKKPVKKPTVPAKKAAAKKKTIRKKPAPVVPVSPAVRQNAFQAVSARISTPLDSIEGAGALVPFFQQISHPAPNGPVRILQYGDSHTASDDWADQMRQDFQRQFGAGGAGFTLPGRPFLGYRRFDSRGSNSAGWYTDGIVTRKGDGVYGLGGISLTAHAPGQTVTLSVECQQLELHYLQQPGGGQLKFSVDGVETAAIDTDGDFGPGVYRYTPGPGPHQFALRTLSVAPVRLFGWVAQNQNGVTYETLGINGAQADLQLDWNAEVLDGEISGRDPALIVLAYGTNEALSKSWTAEQYRASLLEVIRRLRAAAPLASILLVGPPDCEYRLRDGGRRTFPHLDEVIEIQRQVALDSGCAFWDWRARMGGPGAVHQWVQAGLGQADHTHLTSAGYRMVGDMLFSEIMSQYNRFQAAMAGRTDGQ
ncbi:MAG TPA: SGNH/GDSL hydrolase family protein [Bryobacteraceae bacterium]|nr:SGNH/GDSL hydrolase family protein [Bryobacteraceae bacterium]